MSAATGPPRRIRVALVVATRFYREGLAHIFGDDERLDVVAIAGSRAEALPALSSSAPEVVVVDLGRREGLETVRVLRALTPGAKVLALGLPEVAEEVVLWAEAGAAAYVSRDGSLEELTSSIVAVHRGELRCPPSITGALVRRLATLSASLGAAESPLTSRESEVAALLERGLSNKEIAADLQIEVATVKNHVHHVLEKLGARRRAEVRSRARPVALELDPS